MPEDPIRADPEQVDAMGPQDTAAMSFIDPPSVVGGGRYAVRPSIRVAATQATSETAWVAALKARTGRARASARE
jgi:hypothetical protein